MDKKDPFDELLMHCLDDGKTRVYDSKAAEGKTTGNLVNCSYCNEVINVNYRYCPNCGAATVEKSSESTNGFVSIIQQKKAFKVALLDVDRDFNLNGEYFTKLRIRIENLTEERLHLSLVCVDSVIINAAGRQFGPVDSEDIDIPEMFESWFYLYPHAYRDGYSLSTHV